MKEYLLLFRGGDAERKQFSPEEIQEDIQRWQDWISSIAQNGQFAGGQPLEREGKVLKGTAKKMTDGPFMEGKEIVGGFLLIKATSLEEATTISEACPNLRLESGSVEIREVGTLHAM